MAPRKGKEKKEEQVISLGPQVAEGENVFGVCHIFASFNDTFVHVTDLSGKETICRVTGGMKVKADRDESSPYAAMLAAQDVAQRCKELGITALHIKLRATGGNRYIRQGLGGEISGPGCQSTGFEAWFFSCNFAQDIINVFVFSSWLLHHCFYSSHPPTYCLLSTQLHTRYCVLGTRKE